MTTARTARSGTSAAGPARRILAVAATLIGGLSSACSSATPAMDPRPAAQAQMKSPTKIAAELLALHEQYARALARGAEFRAESTALRVVDDRVVIDATASSDGRQLEADLASLGLRHPATYGRVVSGQLPIAAIPQLETVPSLAFARASVRRSPGPPIPPPRP